MRPALLLVPVLAVLVVATALLAAPQGPLPRGRLANEGLDHWEQSDPPPELQPTPPAPQGAATAEVALRDRMYEPGETIIPDGSLVRFVNRGSEAHTVTGRLDGQTAVTLNRVLQPGQEAVLELEPGTYLLRCRYHSADYGEGMGGRVTVQ